MKRQNNFHHYVVKYHKCVRQLKRLELTGRNEHRQSILKKHIVRLLDKLNNLYLGLQKHKVATALACTTLLAVPNAQAQIKFSQDNQPAGLSSLTLENNSVPALVDLDADGDLDLLVGDYYGTLTYFQNTGSPTQPSFAQGTLPGGLAIDVGYHSIPTLADLDSDGDVDLMVGNHDGENFKYLQNTGTTTQPSFTESTVPGLTADLGIASPSLVDLDADGDLDLITLNQQYEFFYYENIGTASQPSFTLGTLPSGLSSIMIDWSSSKALSFSDLDGDGDFDLWLDIVGELVYYENIGTPTQPSFTSASVPSGISEQKENLSSLSFADLDADGDKDVIGRIEDTSKLTYFENTSTVLGNATLVLEKIDFQYHALSKTLEIHSAENLKLNSIQIFDVMGKMIHQTAVKTQSDLSIRLENLSSGIYMVQVQTHQGKITRKIGVH